MSAVSELADKLVIRSAELDPIGATYEGIAGYEEQLTDFSPEGYARRADCERRFLSDLKALNAETERDAVTQRLIIERLSVSLEAYEAGDFLYDLAYAGSPAQSIRSVFDVMPRRSKDEWSHIAHRMERVADSMRSWQLTLTSAVDNGWAPPQRQVAACAQQARGWAGGEADSQPFFRCLSNQYNNSSGVDRKLSERLSRAAEVADASFAAYASFLTEYCMNVATPNDAAGADRYARSVRMQLGTTLDMQETYVWGWSEIERLQAEIDLVCNQIAPGLSRQAITKRLNDDHERWLHGEEELVDWLSSLMDRVIGSLDGVHFDIPLAIKRLDVRIAPPGGPAFPYYTPPSENFDVPGIYWFPTIGRTRFPMWTEISTAYHEGVPGHHLQLGWAKATEGLSRYQRNLFVPGHGEGWALYAERLMDELGFLNRPEYRLDMLFNHLFRAARVVIDLGLHLELPIASDQPFHPGVAWTPELAFEYLQRNSNLPDRFLADEVLRYLGWPGQALAYKVGERVWLQARETAQLAAGDAFSLKDWHAAVLSLGAMGLDQLQTELARTR